MIQKHDITCAFLLECDATQPIENSLFGALYHFIAPQIDFLAPIISEYYFRRQAYVSVVHAAVV